MVDSIIPATRSTQHDGPSSSSSLSFVVGVVAGVTTTAAAATAAAVAYYYYTTTRKDDDDKQSSSLLSPSKYSTNRKHNSHNQPRKSANSASPSSPPPSSSSLLPEELRIEQLSRHTLFFGQDGMNMIRNSKVCIVGLGGVGSHTAIMLARGGIGTGTSSSNSSSSVLRLIDFDQVTLSSLNRHACATLQDVGIPKVTCVRNHCVHGLGLPSQNVEAYVEMYTSDSSHRLLSLPTTSSTSNKWDIVIDCIDDVPTKAALLVYCLRHKIRVVSCMGAGGKCDMTRLHISDLRTASRDPLASKLRVTMKRLIKTQQQQQNNGPASNGTTTTTNKDDDINDMSWLDDMDRLTIIYSSEKTVAKLADLTEEQKQSTKTRENQQKGTNHGNSDNNKSQSSSTVSSEFGAVDGMRVRVLPVLGPIPAIMGQSLASLTMCLLAQQPIHQPVTGERVGKNVRNRLYQKLIDRELKITSKQIVPKYDNDNDDGTEQPPMYTGPVLLDGDDVEYLYGVWRNRCAVTGARIGTALFLARWDLSRPTTTDNVILISAHALEALDRDGKSSVPTNIQKRIEDRLAACRDLNADF